MYRLLGESLLPVSQMKSAISVDDVGFAFTTGVCNLHGRCNDVCISSPES